MRLKKYVSCVLFVLGFILFFHTASAYDSKTTHPALTNEIIDFYNLTHKGSELTNEEGSWLIEGSRLEDTPPRWINHFYDPINKVGWNGEGAGMLPAGLVRVVARLGLSQDKPISAVDWVDDDVQQTDYSNYGGDKTWKMAIDAYISENKHDAFIALGYVLHLLEDMAVPDHTRNDTHANIVGVDEGSPYESYASQYDIDEIKKLNIAKNLFSSKLSGISKSSIKESLSSIAEYSNKYFFSKDTINNSKFDLPKIVREKNGFGYGIDEKGSEFLLVGVDAKAENEKNIKNSYSLNGSKEYWPIFNAYFLRLSKQAVLRGTGVIDLFYGSLEDAQMAKEFPKSIFKVNVSVFRIPVISVYGGLANIVTSIDSIFTGAMDFEPATKITESGVSKIGRSSNLAIDSNKKIAPAAETFSYNEEAESPTVIVEEKNKSISIVESTEAYNSPKTVSITSTSIEIGEGVKPIVKSAYFNSGSPSSEKVLGCTAGGIVISEIMYDAPGSDEGREWIEVHNVGASNLVLTDAKLAEGDTNHLIKLSRGVGDVLPDTYAILANDSETFISEHPEYFGQVFHSAFSLSNYGESVAVKCGDSVLDLVTYSTSTGAQGDGKSIQLLNSIWRYSVPTPGRPTSQVQPPYVAFIYSPSYPSVGEIVSFDASSSTSDGGTTLSYQWNFGDETSISSTIATTTHIFSDSKSFEVSLLVSDKSGSTSSRAVLVDVSPFVQQTTNHIVISEIETGGMRASDEFIELYNPTSNPISLAGYSVQYVSGRSTSTERIRSNSAKKNFIDTAIIPAHGYYALVNSGAISTLQNNSDMIYSSFSLSGDLTGGAIFLTNKNTYITGISDSSIVDSVAYGDVAISGITTSSIPIAGKSLERKANSSSTLESMVIGADRFEGNGYDTDDNANDLVVRDLPELQSTRNYPESRPMPTSPGGTDGTTSTIGIYDATSSIVFTWTEARDFLGATSSVRYEINAIDSASSSIVVATSSLTYKMAIPETTQKYIFGLRACDAEDLCSAISTFTVFVRKNKVPTAEFSFDAMDLRVGDVISFDAASSTDSDGSIVSYDWDFDDGGTPESLGVVGTHAFDIAGVHNVKLVTTDNDGAVSSTSSSLVVAPKLEMTTSTFMLHQEDFSGGRVGNIGFQSGTQLQYIGTDISGTIKSISVYMSMNSYGGSPGSLSAQLFESDSEGEKPRIAVVNMYNPRGANDDWVLFELNHTMSPNKFYWIGVPSVSTGPGYLETFPAKSSALARYPYDSHYLYGYIDYFTGGGDMFYTTKEGAQLAYRVIGTLPE